MFRSSSRVLKLIGSISLALLLTAGFLAVLAPQATPAAKLATPGSIGSDFAQVIDHLNAGRRLHYVVSSDDYPEGTYVAPDANWTGSMTVQTGAYQAYEAYALRSIKVAVFRSSLKDNLGQDVAWENAYVEDILQNGLRNSLRHAVLTETQIANGALNSYNLLIMPAFRAGSENNVLDQLGQAGMAGLKTFVQNGGTVYAQGISAYLLEAAGVVPDGTVDFATPMELPVSEGSQGLMSIVDTTNMMALGWKTERMWMLDDPTLHAIPPMGVVANYVNTLAGETPAILYGVFGQGRVILMAGHPTSPYFPDQHPFFINGILTAMSERAELSGRAIQTYNPNPGPTVIPAYEAGVPVSATLCVDHLWPEEIVFTNTQVVERVQSGFIVDQSSITPAADSVIVATNGTTITWNLGDLSNDPAAGCLHYVAVTEEDAMAPGTRTFARGQLIFNDNGRQVKWSHADFTLSAMMPARLVGQHDKEMDAFYGIPPEGVTLDEFVTLENKEAGKGFNLKASRYIPLIAPIVGLENQAEPLATSGGETVWTSNEFFLFRNGKYPLPIGITNTNGVINLSDWDGTTFVTMTTPGGYYLGGAPAGGYNVTIPTGYESQIIVTQNHELLLPAAKVEWDLGDFPGYWYEMPALRYGILSKELGGRGVSFSGDVVTGTVQVNATGGSVYTGLGTDPLIYRQYLLDVQVAPPAAPTTATITYEDVWSRSHDLPLRASFYDLFNLAGCSCQGGEGGQGGPGGGCVDNHGQMVAEMHQRMNVTFGIKIDADGDGVREKLITDFAGWTAAFNPKGVLPTRVKADLDIYIKTRSNVTYTIGYKENVLDGSIFRGLGFNITPYNNTWANSYDASYSVLTDTFSGGGYDHLIFQQQMPANGTDVIHIRAKIDATSRQIEGLLKLHDGVRFVYRQGAAGPAQYEVHDTHVQGVIGARTDANVDTRENPARLSTYTDTMFASYRFYDSYDWRSFSNDNFLQSWGFGDTSATTYVGGRDGRTLLSSLVRLGDRTLLRVEVNNNSGVDWTNVKLTPQPPAGVTATEWYTQNLPATLWPDLPFLHTSVVSDTSYGIYYFALDFAPTATDLRGKVLEIPIQFEAVGAPANFAIPPAKVGVRTASGGQPHYTLGTSRNLKFSDELHAAFAPSDVRLMNAAQYAELWKRVDDDKLYIPRHTTAITYFQSMTRTLPFTFSGQVMSFDLPVDMLPWTDNGVETSIYAVALTDFHGQQSTRYRFDNNAKLKTLDDFGMSWTASASPDYIEAIGASVKAYDSINCITSTLSNGPITIVFPNDQPDVEVELIASNDGTDVATNVNIDVEVGPLVSATIYPDSVEVTPTGLIWHVGDLAPGVTRHAFVTFHIDTQTPRPEGSAGRAGDFLLIKQPHANFINTYSGREIHTQVGTPLTIPYGKAPYTKTFLPVVKAPSAFPLWIGDPYTTRPVTKKGEIFYARDASIPLNLPKTGRFYLSSQADALKEVAIDDRLVITQAGQEDFSQFFPGTQRPTPVIIEIPRALMEKWAGKTVRFEYHDEYGSVVEASAIWLIWVP